MGMKAKTALDKAKKKAADWHKKQSEINSPYLFEKLAKAQRKVKSIIKQSKGTQGSLI